MDESEDNMSSEDLKSSDSPITVKAKPKKRSLIERELETNLTARVTSPVSTGDGTSTSRYGRARRLKSEIELSDSKKATIDLKSPLSEKSPVKVPSPVYKMHASNSPLRSEQPKTIGVETFLENQIESIYQENISLSRFATEEVKKTSPSPAKKFPKVYIRTDLIQKREADENVTFIKDMFSPGKSASKSSNTHLNNILERSSERYNIASKQQNGFLDNSSVVKTLDFDSKKKKKDSKDKSLSKSDLFDLEAKCAYQVGDLAWARMGTYPFWPSIITRDPANGIFVKKKLFGRIERDVIHVTFFGDNGRRGWIVDTMLRKYLGQLEFETTRENFTPEDKKKDPRLYAAFFVSEKKQALWNTSVEEAEMLLREPKRLRIDIFNDMLEKSRSRAKQQKSGKISRTDSDVSLSESLYDSLFSEDDGKADSTERSRNRTRNKSLDVFEVVTACLDNMAAKTGITKIQRQSHMDRWLQKAKSKTPEKTQAKSQVPQMKLDDKKETKVISSKKKKSLSRVAVKKPYGLRKSMTETQTLLPFQNEHDYSKVEATDSDHNYTDSCKNLAAQKMTEKDNVDDPIVVDSQSSEHETEESQADTEEVNAKEATKVNGKCDSDVKTINDDSQDHVSITSTATSPCKITDDEQTPKQDDKEKEPAFENDETTQATVNDGDQAMSPVYEDSFDENSQHTDSQIDESEKSSAEKKPESVETDSQDEITNDTISTERSCISMNEDSDYKPQNSTESEDDSMNADILTDDSIEMVSLGEEPSKSNTGKDLLRVQDNSENEAKEYNKFTTINKYPENRENEVFNLNIKSNNAISISIESNNRMTSMNIVETVKDAKAMNGHVSVKEVDMDVDEVHLPSPKPQIVENGFHDAEKHMNGDVDSDVISLHSEDSVSSTKSDGRRKLRSRQNKNQDRPLENPEFVKYLELRQDAIMDENPELNQDEIVAYLYKTWLYEQNSKSDDKKTEDLRELNLVKGLNPEPMEKKKTKEVDQPKQRHSHRKNLSLNRNIMNRFLQRKTREKPAVYSITDSDTESVKDVDSQSEEESPRYSPILSKADIEMQTDTQRSMEEKIAEDRSQDETNRIDTIAVNNPHTNNIVNESIQTDKSASPVTVIEVQNKQIDETEIALGSRVVAPIDEHINDDENEKMIEKELETILSKADDVNKEIQPTEPNAVPLTLPEEPDDRLKSDCDTESLNSLDSETPLIKCKLRSKSKRNNSQEVKARDDEDTMSINSEGSEVSTKRKKKSQKRVENALEDPEFVKYLELRQDSLIDENPELSHDEIVSYLYQTWLYEENTKSEIKKNDDIEQSGLVKGLKEPVQQQPKKVKRKAKTDKEPEKETDEDATVKDKPRRKVVKPYYNEEFSDVEEELEVFPIFNPNQQRLNENGETTEPIHEVNDIDEVELYFEELARPKPNVFKGLIREKVCELCEMTGNLVKCKGCNGMFHVECVSKEIVEVETPAPTRGRKKKKRPGRKPKISDEFDSQDDNTQNVSEENASIEEILESESHTVDAETLEAQIEAKMKELLENEKIDYDSYSSDDGCDWSETIPGKCEIIDIKLKPRRSNEVDYSNFKCKNCQKYDVPVCFVCKSAVSKNEETLRQKCHVAHCHKYYHLKCLDHWPQAQFNGGEPSKTNKKINEYFEALTCPRHVCHTCVSDDPRGCKTRFSGDKLARCVRCPATYHSFTRCLPAGTQILTASHIICPRHYEHRPGKVPCHVNTGWCFICALGGSLICCEYCPTSFHAECLNIKPPEGGYMCEDCETGRLPLYGEMVWVKLGHYRWWPGIILHPSEIPENIMAVKHNLGEFVVRFFGQYDHYWVNRGRVFPFQEGDSGRISSQKSKIDAAFTTAMEHAQRACEILKAAQPNEEESLDIASSLLPPHYVKLKVNKPCGSLCGRKLEDPESSLTQCECNPNDDDPCGPYSQCLNRMLLTECGPTCKAGDRCNNRAFEKRLYPKLVPYRTPSRGWGLKTLEDIKAGQFVIEYVGELIDEEEFRRRMRRKHEIRDENFYFLTLDKERMIDAGPKGNLARFMNHCCEPNCETQKWTVLGDVRVGLFALYDIPANSEVTFNYNLECAGIEKKRCMCGAKRCSGYIGAKPKQEESHSKKPKLPGKRTYKKRKPAEESPSTKNKPKRPIGRPPKPRELTEIEKDLLIIRNATNGISSDESTRSLSSDYERHPKALKRKRVSFSTEEIILYDGSESPSVKKHKLEDRTDVGD
ncbi:hypothetical protein HW555_011338 [Spodoptera exigua]|uniref:Uncharacterized protein n=1 Tax=Spodoptera exigua TaxID=7107 RepID=A0A835L029_SPOEX|nr:hypothetical protein HW555_011338 [Spodoptera exigua]